MAELLHYIVPAISISESPNSGPALGRPRTRENTEPSCCQQTPGRRLHHKSCISDLALLQPYLLFFQQQLAGLHYQNPGISSLLHIMPRLLLKLRMNYNIILNIRFTKYVNNILIPPVWTCSPISPDRRNSQKSLPGGTSNADCTSTEVTEDSSIDQQVFNLPHIIKHTKLATLTVLSRCKILLSSTIN